MPYGYLGQNTPNQTVSNSGVFSISDVADLTKQGKFGGSLELIEEQNPSASSTVDFTTLNNYDIHYLTFNYEATSDTQTQLRFSNNGGTSYIASGYQYAMQYGGSGGLTSEPKSTSATYIRIAGTTTANNRIQGYIYFYNLLNSLKYSFITTHNFWKLTLSGYNDLYQFGGGVLPTAEIHNAIRILGSGNITGNFKLYGVKQL